DGPQRTDCSKFFRRLFPKAAIGSECPENSAGGKSSRTILPSLGDLDRRRPRRARGSQSLARIHCSASWLRRREAADPDFERENATARDYHRVLSLDGQANKS